MGLLPARRLACRRRPHSISAAPSSCSHPRAHPPRAPHRPAACPQARAHHSGSHTDPHAPSPIDTLTVLAGRGTDIPKGEIAFAQSIEVLTYQIGTLVDVPRHPSGKLISRDAFRPSFESLIQATAPVPPQLLHAKNVYVVNDAPARSRYANGFVTSLTTWGYYHLVASPTAADVVFHFHDDEANGVSVTVQPPGSTVILWTITDPHFGFYHQAGEHRVTALNQNLISLLKLLNGIPLSPAETAALH